ncbi:hypothetical protein ACFSTH_13050 [Paenibacillus yanchengensis]|uniref:Phage holin family protein n=1 Tax=Paenibacillus yanchengensis TaxID=2035833 RepID=A0ABW4YNH2_9BACL
MLSRNTIIAIISFLVIPVLINYFLLSWRAPRVNGSEGDWLGFLANYIGLIGAVVIAVIQFTKQRESDIKKDIEQNRSYVDIQDFNAKLMLVDTKTHENSRIIMTEGFESLLMKPVIPEYENLKISYLKISHYGTAPIIINCNIEVQYNYILDGVQKHKGEKYSLASIEQGIEVFVPLVPIESTQGMSIEMVSLKFEYSTLKNERLKLIRLYNPTIETLYGEKEEVIYCEELKLVNWIFPNKQTMQRKAP